MHDLRVDAHSSRKAFPKVTERKGRTPTRSIDDLAALGNLMFEIPTMAPFKDNALSLLSLYYNALPEQRPGHGKNIPDVFGWLTFGYGHRAIRWVFSG